MRRSLRQLSSTQDRATVLAQEMVAASGGREVKRCTKCGCLKPLEQFSLRSDKKGATRSHCRQCSQQYYSGYYQSHKAQYLKYRRRNKRRYIWRNLSRVTNILNSRSCVDCGLSDPLVLEFDHACDNKTADVSRLVVDGVRWERVLAEIEKCVIRCANCHRRTTAFRRWLHAH